ncbi:MAG: DUF4382 domain-containing protein, partial [Aliifodinibius sp.]|nr:DUF4382 domain-containing protein [Fodinibius sp.]
MRIFLAFMILLGFFFIGCEKDSTSTEVSSETGTLRIYLTDAPPTAQFDSINIRFSQVSAHLDSAWITVQGNPMIVNMLELTNGDTIIFGSSDIPAGKYTQIRIMIDDAWVVIDSVRKPLQVPSSA